MQYKDLLQLIIDACEETENAATSTDSSSSGSGPMKLTDDEVVNVTMDMLLAGYETTANTLGFISYLLATNPEEQEKLRKEMADYHESNPVSVGGVRRVWSKAEDQNW